MHDQDGVCFGYRPLGLARFVQLRAGDGDPLAVEEAPDEVTRAAVERMGDPLLTWVPRPENPFSARLYRDGADFVFDVDGLGRYAVDPMAPAIAVPKDADAYLRESRLWGIPASLCFSHRGDIPLHAAAVDVGGSALLFVGPSRHGKTTLAAGFQVRGHRLLAEDTACVRLDPGPSVVPGPPTLRLRPDVAAAVRPTGAEAVVTDPDRLHLLLAPEHRGTGAPVPLAGIVFLHVGAGPEAVLEQRAPAQCLPALWITSHNLPTDSDRVQRFEQIAALAAAVPLWDLVRPLELAALPALIDLLVQTCTPGDGISR